MAPSPRPDWGLFMDIGGQPSRELSKAGAHWEEEGEEEEEDKIRKRHT